jgi:hypothetical protein
MCGGNTVVCAFIQPTDCNRVESQNLASATLNANKFKSESGQLTHILDNEQ